MSASNLEKGFAALVATVLIAAVLLVLAVSVASSGFQGRFSVFDGEVKEVSRALAESCVEIAMLEYEKDSSYAGNDDVVVIDAGNGLECTIHAVGGSPSSLDIEVWAEFQGSYTSLEVEVDATSDYTVNSWKEVPERP